MAAVQTEPPAIASQAPFPPAVSGPLPPSGTLPPTLRRMFPPPVVQALNGLWQQMEAEALMPLFFADRTALAQQFQSVYPRFMSYYVSATLALLPSLKDPSAASLIVDASFELLRAELRERGRARLGDDATLGALIGLHAMAGVLRAAARRTVDSPEQREALEPMAGGLVALSTAYWLTIFSVSFALSQGDRFAGRWENIAQLAWWSRGYAAQIHDLAKRHGLLRVPPPPGPLPEASTDEDSLLAEAGLEHWRELLARDEAP